MVGGCRWRCFVALACLAGASCHRGNPTSSDGGTSSPDGPPASLVTTRTQGWLLTAGGKGWDVVLDLTVDRTGNIILATLVETEASLGSMKITPPQPMAIVVVKLDPKGNPLWHFEREGLYRGGEELHPIGVAVDAAGNIYFGDGFYGPSPDR